MLVATKANSQPQQRIYGHVPKLAPNGVTQVYHYTGKTASKAFNSASE